MREGPKRTANAQKIQHTHRRAAQLTNLLLIALLLYTNYSNTPRDSLRSSTALLSHRHRNSQRRSLWSLPKDKPRRYNLPPLPLLLPESDLHPHPPLPPLRSPPEPNILLHQQLSGPDGVPADGLRRNDRREPPQQGH